MKLIELVPYLLDRSKLDKVYSDLGLNDESEDILIYMKDSISLDSEIYFFESEGTEDDLEFEKDGISYVHLFSFDHIVDLIEYDLDLKDKGYSITQIAERLLEYRIMDA